MGLAGEDDGIGAEAFGQSHHERIGQPAESPVPAGDVHQAARVPQRPDGAHDRHLRPARARRTENHDSHATIIARPCA